MGYPRVDITCYPQRSSQRSRFLVLLGEWFTKNVSCDYDRPKVSGGLGFVNPPPTTQCMICCFSCFICVLFSLEKWKRPLWPLVTPTCTYYHNRYCIYIPESTWRFYFCPTLSEWVFDLFLQPGKKKRGRYLKISHIWAMIEWIGRHDDAPAFFPEL